MRGQRKESVGLPLRAFLEVVRVGSAALLVFVVARAAYFPIWAAGADDDQLASSWGGPSPILATIAHWVVAVLIGLACLVAIVVTTQVLQRRT